MRRKLQYLTVAIGLMIFAAGCASSKCDCPKVGEVPVQQEDKSA